MVTSNALGHRNFRPKECSIQLGWPRLEAVRAIRKFTVRPRLPQALRPLETLAHNLRWSWHQPTQRLFADIDSRLWDEVSHDPIAMLGHLPPQRLDALAADSQLVDR